MKFNEEIKISSQGNYLGKYEKYSNVFFICNSTFVSTWFRRQMHKIIGNLSLSQQYIKMQFVTKLKWGQSCIGQSFCRILRQSWFLFKLDCYKFRIFIAITKTIINKVSKRRRGKKLNTIEINTNKGSN